MSRKGQQSTHAEFLGTGVRMERQGDLIYVYLDTPEAVRLAPLFLPKTKRGVAPDGSEAWVYRASQRAP